MRWFLLLSCLLLPGCLQADLHCVVMPDGSGKLEFEVGVHQASLPFFLKDPLRGLDDPVTMRRNTTVGLVAWGEPRVHEDDGWKHVQLRAYFEDVNNLRFYHTREEGPARLVGFGYQPWKPEKVVHMELDLEPELTAPIPLKRLSEGRNVQINPDLALKFLPALRPLLGNVRMVFRLTAPGPLTRASGFGKIDGRTARYEGDRDAFLLSLQERAGALVDADSLLVEHPQIRWTEDTVPDAEVEAFQAEFATAREWWAQQNPPREDDGGE